MGKHSPAKTRDILFYLTPWPWDQSSQYLKSAIPITCYVLISWMNLVKIVLWWMSQKTFDDKSTLVQVMVWCHQAISHYLSKYWPRLWCHMASLSHDELSHHWLLPYTNLARTSKLTHGPANYEVMANYAAEYWYNKVFIANNHNNTCIYIPSCMKSTWMVSGYVKYLNTSVIYNSNYSP